MISVIIPTVNQVDLVKQCYQSFIQTVSETPYEIIIVDDGSPMHIQQALMEWADSVPIKCILKPSNSGFSAAVNAGIREAQGQCVLLVNNDIVFHEPGWLGHMIQTIQLEPKVGIVGARLLYSNHTIQHGGVFYSGRGNFDHRYRFLPGNHPPALVIEDVNAVTGALMLIRKELFQHIGMLSEEYYIAYEDIDLCYRAKQHGWRIIYCGTASAVHLEGQTRGTTTANKNPFWRRKEMESRAKFWSKWMGVRF